MGTGQVLPGGKFPRGKSNTWHGAGSLLSVVSTGSPIISAQSTISVKAGGTGFIGITDKCEKSVCLSAAYRRIANLINDDKLCFLDIFESESGCTLCFCSVENLNQVGHLLKTYSIAAVDSL